MTSSTDRVTILQTGRLGDLWFTAPLAWHLHQQGLEVEVAFNAAFGQPFQFFPYVRPLPMPLKNWFPGPRFGYGFNEMIWQPAAWLRLKRRGRRLIWNQIFPYRLIPALFKGKSFVECWYEKYPAVNFRHAPCTLEVTRNDRVLVFAESQSIRFRKDRAYYEWIDRNLKTLVRSTGLRPLAVAYGRQPDHPEYETWRGSLEAYQRLIAGCGLIYGISTSAHVLAQLLGKPIVVLYERQQHPLGRIGGETIALRQGEELTGSMLAKASENIASSGPRPL